MKRYTREIKAKDASIKWKTDMPQLYGDQLHFEALFQNLISNALKYAFATPVKIIIQVIEKNEFWKFSIRDNGIGIDAKYPLQIFDVLRGCPRRMNFMAGGLN
ncbi:MAG: ATP-binding protein [Candidatus Heimdallarchaeota archaeon]|nr:ATP-binding protein [Candidatus Heimdallarchaeota archaeon]